VVVGGAAGVHRSVNWGLKDQLADREEGAKDELNNLRSGGSAEVKCNG
jgi:hypothetical protein